MGREAEDQQLAGKTLDFWEVTRFYAPVASTSMFIAITFNMLNSTMARMPDAALALAAFAVGFSVADMIALPAMTAQPWWMSRGRNRRTFWHGLRIMSPLMVLGILLIALLAYTPLGPLFYTRLLSTPAEMTPGITSVMRVAILLPIVMYLRVAGQNALILCRATHFMTLAVTVRLVYVLALAILLPRLVSWPGALAGAFLWVSGLGVEALVCVWASRRIYHRFPSGDPQVPLPSPTAIWQFVLPLVGTNLLWALRNPLLNAGLAQTVAPELNLAVHRVAWSVAWVLLAFIQQGFNKAVVVFWRDRLTLEALSRFVWRLAFLLTGLMLLSVLTGGTDWFLSEVVGAPDDMVRASRWPLLIMSLLPLPSAGIELCVGRLLRIGATRAIGVSKAAGLIVLVVTLWSGGSYLGASLGALSLLTSSCAEYAVAYYPLRSIAAHPPSVAA